jgi:23S rRNA pseudouridine1911/1915/1917 synthase
MDVEVDADNAGRRVDQYLSDVPEVGSRARAERLVRDGLVTINGRALTAKSYRVKTGDTVTIEDAALVEPPRTRYEGGPLPVLFEDDDVLVVDKPAGMVVHPAPGFRGLTMVEILEQGGVHLAPNIDEQVNRPGVVHRLDKDTSGAIMFAKTPLAQSQLQLALRERTARREYLALVEGHVPSRAGRVEAPIGPDVRDHSRRSIDTDSPKDAVTHFVVTEVLPSETLLRLRLETGRTHQIRVHLEAIGHPVVGDSTYGNGSAYGLTRQFLHAARLTFPHPRTGEPVETASPLPDDLQEALSLARRADRT